MQFVILQENIFLVFYMVNYTQDITYLRYLLNSIRGVQIALCYRFFLAGGHASQPFQREPRRLADSYQERPDPLPGRYFSRMGNRTKRTAEAKYFDAGMSVTQHMNEVRQAICDLSLLPKVIDRPIYGKILRQSHPKSYILAIRVKLCLSLTPSLNRSASLLIVFVVIVILNYLFKLLFKYISR